MLVPLAAETSHRHPRSVTLIRCLRASAIWQATVRFQIRSNKPELIRIEFASQRFGHAEMAFRPAESLRELPERS